MAAVEEDEETQRLFDLCPDMLSISSFDGFLLVINRAWTDTLGWSREELLAEPYGRFVHPDDVDRTVEVAEQLAAGRPVSGFENRYRHRDGSYRWLSWDATADVGRQRMYAAVRDVTDQRRREALAHELETISGVGTWELDPRAGHVYWSAGTHLIHGTDPQRYDPDLHDPLSFYPEEGREQLVPALDHLRSEGTPYDLELPFVTIDGRHRWIRTTATALCRDGQVLRAYGTIQDITDEVAERTRLRRFRELLELSEESIVELGPEGVVTYANSRFAALVGAAVEEVTGRPLDALLLDDAEARRFLAALARPVADDRVVRAELRVQTPGGPRNVQVAAGRERVDGGTAGRVTLVMTDVTQRRQREVELAATTALLEQAQRTARIGHWQLDTATGRLQLSPVVAELVADGCQDLGLRDYLRAVHPQDRRRARDGLDLGEGQEASELVQRVRTPSGRSLTVHLHVTPILGEDGTSVVGLRGTLQDVTALHRTERALQRVLTATNDGWFDEDLMAATGSYSDRWWEIHGLPVPTEPMPAGVWRRLTPEDEVPALEERFATAVAAGEPTLRLEGHIRHARGHLVPVVVRLSIEYDREGRPVRLTGATSDVTEQVQAEQAKDAFVSTISHELRTPLTAIAGALELLVEGRGGPLPAAAAPLLAMGRRNTERLHALISDLLDIEQLRTGTITLELTAQPVAPIAARVLEDLRTVADQREVTLALEADTAALARLDATRLAQAFTNLVSNAVRFSPEQATVQVRIRQVDARVVVEVIDAGPGLPASFRDRAFQRFAQADPSDPRSRGGTGLGLAISREIVHRHGGRIDYESSPGHTRFWIELPATGDAAAAGGPCPRPRHPRTVPGATTGS